MAINQIIRTFIENNMLVFEDEVSFSDEDNIFQMGVVNSLFAMKLLNFVEKEFNIEIANEDMEIKNLSSINNITRLIMPKKEYRGGQSK